MCIRDRGLDMYLSKKIYTYNKIIKVEIDSKEIKYNIHEMKIDLIYWKNCLLYTSRCV